MRKVVVHAKGSGAGRRGRSSEELSLVRDAGQLLGRTLDLNAIYDTFHELVARAMDCDGLLVSSYTAADNLIRCAYAWVEGERVDAARFPPLPLAPEGHGMQSEVIRTGRPILIRDAVERSKSCTTLYHVYPDGTVRDEPAQSKHTRAAMMVPLLLEGQVLGTVQVMSHRKGAFTRSHMRILEAMTLQVAAASRNAYLYQQARTEIAAREQLEAELRRRAEELGEADRRKDQFLATLAHELRNPLGAISNALHLLQSSGAGEAVRQRAMGVLERQVRQQARLVDDLLDVSRVSRGKVELRCERLDLRWLAEDAVTDHRPVLDAAGLAVALELPDAPVHVDGDPVRLAQVVGNLLDNAGKFTGSGGRILVRTWRDGEHACVSIADTGDGIDPEILPRVFDAFTQAGKGQDRSRGGLGLGLALVKGLVAMHGGQVEARSDGPGCGAEFVVRLPGAAATRAEERNGGGAEGWVPGCQGGDPAHAPGSA